MEMKGTMGFGQVLEAILENSMAETEVTAGGAQCG